MITGDTYTFKILRYDASEPGKEPAFATYRIKVIPGLTVLAVLIRIRDEIDGTLSFRSSCRSAVCGSCAMVINGRIDLACRTQVASFDKNDDHTGTLAESGDHQGPRGRPDAFLGRVRKGKTVPYQEESRPGEGDPPERGGEEPDRPVVNCILCASCYGACPVLARNPDYAGPAALAKLARFVLDSRDERPYSILEGVNGEKGVWGCDTMLRCIDACPKDVRPTDGIVDLRKTLLKYKFGARFRQIGGVEE